MLKQILIIVLTATIGMVTAPAWACSVESGYKVPTTLQLVEASDAIVLAKIEAAELHPELGLRTAKFVPITLLKGDILPQAISYEAAFVSSSRWKAVASAPHDLMTPHPNVFSGGCNRQVFDKGMLIVAFLEKEGDVYRVNAPPFTRALEDVPSPDALWVEAIKIYIQIAALPQIHRKSAIEAELARLVKVKNDPDTELLAHLLAKTLHDEF